MKNYELLQTSGKRWHLYMSTQEEDTQRNFNGDVCQILSKKDCVGKVHKSVQRKPHACVESSANT